MTIYSLITARRTTNRNKTPNKNSKRENVKHEKYSRTPEPSKSLKLYRVSTKKAGTPQQSPGSIGSGPGPEKKASLYNPAKKSGRN